LLPASLNTCSQMPGTLNLFPPEIRGRVQGSALFNISRS
jgi:hypothetical protein